MIFYNSTDCDVLICIDGQKIVLQPNTNVSVNCSQSVVVDLKHTYGSTAMPKKDIALDDLDTSVVSLLTSSYKEPYFNLVLDCRYQITASQQAQVYIQKENIRPVYPCSYDRLFPVVTDGVVNEIAYTFPERKTFEKHYLDAINGTNIKIVTILVIVLAVLSLPLILLCFFSKVIIGIVVALLTTITLALVYLFGRLISKFLSKAESVFVFSEFESNRIAENFRKNAKGQKS